MNRQKLKYYTRKLKRGGTTAVLALLFLAAGAGLEASVEQEYSLIQDEILIMDEVFYSGADLSSSKEIEFSADEEERLLGELKEIKTERRELAWELEQEHEILLAASKRPPEYIEPVYVQALPFAEIKAGFAVRKAALKEGKFGLFLGRNSASMSFSYPAEVSVIRLAQFVFGVQSHYYSIRKGYIKRGFGRDNTNPQPDTSPASELKTFSITRSSINSELPNRWSCFRNLKHPSIRFKT